MTINEFEAQNIVIALEFIEKVFNGNKPWDYLEKHELVELNLDKLSETCLRQRRSYIKSIQPVKKKFKALVKEANQLLKGE